MHWKARATYFYDPDGNLVEFIERQDAGFAQTGPYFQGISEIGIAVNSVPAATAWLANKLKLKTFAKLQSQSDFDAVGDDYGLFIIAQTGRRWLFTTIPASEQDCTIHFTDQVGNQYIVKAASIRQGAEAVTDNALRPIVHPESA